MSGMVLSSSSRTRQRYRGGGYSRRGPPRARRRIVRIQPRVGGFYGRFANGGELKFHDVDVDQAIADISGGIIQNAGTLVVIPQDVTESGRVGRKITIKSIMMKGSLTLLAANGSAALVDGYTMRIIIYLDKQCNGATAAVTDILESANYQSFKNLSNSGRFLTISDKTMEVNGTVAAGTAAADDQASRTINFSFYKKCAIKLEYDDSAQTGAIGTIRSNNIGMLLISRTTLSTCSMDSKIRMRFSDA